MALLDDEDASHWPDTAIHCICPVGGGGWAVSGLSYNSKRQPWCAPLSGEGRGEWAVGSPTRASTVVRDGDRDPKLGTLGGEMGEMEEKWGRNGEEMGSTLGHSGTMDPRGNGARVV